MAQRAAVHNSPTNRKSDCIVPLMLEWPGASPGRSHEDCRSRFQTFARIGVFCVRIERFSSVYSRERVADGSRAAVCHGAGAVALRACCFCHTADRGTSPFGESLRPAGAGSLGASYREYPLLSHFSGASGDAPRGTCGGVLVCAVFPLPAILLWAFRSKGD